MADAPGGLQDEEVEVVQDLQGATAERDDLTADGLTSNGVLKDPEVAADKTTTSDSKDSVVIPNTVVGDVGGEKDSVVIPNTVVGDVGGEKKAEALSEAPHGILKHKEAGEIQAVTEEPLSKNTTKKG